MAPSVPSDRLHLAEWEPPGRLLGCDLHRGHVVSGGYESVLGVHVNDLGDDPPADRVHVVCGPDGLLNGEYYGGGQRRSRVWQGMRQLLGGERGERDRIAEVWSRSFD